jgi:hypothetical protein
MHTRTLTKKPGKTPASPIARSCACARVDARRGCARLLLLRLRVAEERAIEPLQHTPRGTLRR